MAPSLYSICCGGFYNINDPINDSAKKDHVKNDRAKNGNVKNDNAANDCVVNDCTVNDKAKVKTVAKSQSGELFLESRGSSGDGEVGGGGNGESSNPENDSKRGGLKLPLKLPSGAYAMISF